MVAFRRHGLGPVAYGTRNHSQCFSGTRLKQITTVIGMFSNHKRFQVPFSYFCTAHSSLTFLYVSQNVILNMCLPVLTTSTVDFKRDHYSTYENVTFRTTELYLT